MTFEIGLVSRSGPYWDVVSKSHRAEKLTMFLGESSSVSIGNGIGHGLGVVMSGVLDGVRVLDSGGLLLVRSLRRFWEILVLM